MNSFTINSKHNVTGDEVGLHLKRLCPELFNETEKQTCPNNMWKIEADTLL